MRHFEDFRVGDTATYGRHLVTREEIVSFASQFERVQPWFQSYPGLADPKAA